MSIAGRLSMRKASNASDLNVYSGFSSIFYEFCDCCNEYVILMTMTSNKFRLNLVAWPSISKRNYYSHVISTIFTRSQSIILLEHMSSDEGISSKETNFSLDLSDLAFKAKNIKYNFAGVELVPVCYFPRVMCYFLHWFITELQNVESFI